MTKCTIAEYKTSAAAKVALEALQQEAFTVENVSVVSNASDPAAKHLEHLHDDHATKLTSSTPDGRSTSLGMLIGGSIAAPIAAGTLIGPFIIAGPLIGIAIGGAVGSLLSGLARWGVTHDVSGDYEQRVQNGSVIVIVHDVTEQRLNEARVVLKSTDPLTLESFEEDG